MDCVTGISFSLFRNFTFVLRQMWLLQSSASKRLLTASSQWCTHFHHDSGVHHREKLLPVPAHAVRQSQHKSGGFGQLKPRTARFLVSRRCFISLLLQMKKRSLQHLQSIFLSLQHHGGRQPRYFSPLASHNWNSFTVASSVTYWYQTAPISYFLTLNCSNIVNAALSWK